MYTNTSGKGPDMAKTSGDGIKGTSTGNAVNQAARSMAAKFANGSLNYNSNECSKGLRK